MRPLGVGWWEWHIEPRLTRAWWRLTRRCACCGQKGRSHKFTCPALRRLR